MLYNLSPQNHTKISQTVFAVEETPSNSGQSTERQLLKAGKITFYILSGCPIYVPHLFGLRVVSSDINKMTHEVVKTVVPNELGQIRVLSGFHSGRKVINDMLNVAGQNINLEDSSLTPAERVFLFVRMQTSLAYDIELQKETVSIKYRKKKSIYISKVLIIRLVLETGSMYCIAAVSHGCKK